MHATAAQTLKSLSRSSSEDVAKFHSSLASTARNDLVQVQWTVTYDEPGHDILSVADVSVADKADSLLQVWLRNAASGIWIPEMQPWEVSVVEFQPAQAVRSAKLGLLDSKWTKEDVGRKYHYVLWGFIQHSTEVVGFSFEKWGVYPGDA